jgi:hypothetical protein
VTLTEAAAGKPKIQRFLQWLEQEAALTRHWLVEFLATAASPNRKKK